MILVLFGVNTEALGHEVNLDAIDVLNQTRDRWHELLHDVPVNVRLQAILTSHDFIEAKCGLIKGELRLSLRHDSILLLLLALVLLLADDVPNKIADQIGRRLSALLDESVRHYDMGQALEVLVLRRGASQLLRDHVLGQVHRAVLHSATDTAEIIIELEDDRLTLLTRQYLL